MNDDPARRLIDVSHTVEDGLVTYPGLPAPLVCDYLSREASRAHYAEGTTFQIARIEMVANTGTYVDAPFHRFADGADLAVLDLARLADLEGLVVDATAQPGRAIGAALFAGLDLRDRAVLVRTGWDRHWATPRYLSGHPFLTEEAALLLRDAGAPGRDRLAQYRQYRRRAASCPYRPARRGHSHRRAPVRARPPARQRFPLPCRAREVPRRRHLPGTCLWSRGIEVISSPGR